MEDYYSADNGKTTIVECRNMFRELRKRRINVPLELFTAGVVARNEGELMQHAFPFLSANDREFLMTGMTDEEQDMFYD